MTTKEIKRLLILNVPYLAIGGLATNIGEAWRVAKGTQMDEKIRNMIQTIPLAFQNSLISFHPKDLLFGLLVAVGIRLAVYFKGKNAKKFRHGEEYGSARWGNHKDIEPYMAENFKDNIILTSTERLMMSNRPKNPKYARNKNVLVVGGSGSGVP